MIINFAQHFEGIKQHMILAVIIAELLGSKDNRIFHHNQRAVGSWEKLPAVQCYLDLLRHLSLSYSHDSEDAAKALVSLPQNCLNLKSVVMTNVGLLF